MTFFILKGREGEHEQGSLHHGPLHLVLELAPVHPRPHGDQRQEDQTDRKLQFLKFNLAWFLNLFERALL